MTKLAIMLPLALGIAPSALEAQDATLPDVQTYLCTFGPPEEGVAPMTVVVLNMADGSATSIEPWFSAEVIRNGSELLIRDGFNIMQVRVGPSVIVDEDGGISRGACTDATIIVRNAAAAALDAAVDANPNLEVQRALERAEAAEARAAEAEASVAAAEQVAPQALEAVRRRNSELGRQVEVLSETLSTCRAGVQQVADELPSISSDDPQRRATQIADWRTLALQGCGFEE